jgi:cellulose synthase/poly-beta-1,6-N-acetylglucosamine synthase-like glycosyltransferase
MLTTFTEIIIWLIFAIYFLALFFIFLYCLSQADLVVRFIRKNRKISADKTQSPTMSFDELPGVTVQLPVYNEMYVVERLIDSITALEYPKNKLEIQVLDDSTDETTHVIDSKVDDLRAKGVDIQHVRRDNRQGFKAGALANGLRSAKGDYIAIFDADFLPKPDFLLKTIPYFRDNRIGVVQTKWGHVNENYSILTRLQAFALDAHFNIEQQGRDAGSFYFNFNGTAGVLRKQCILDAGNWQSDTLTEDLDLSYRAQLKGWKFKYLGDVVTPAEIPVTMSGLKAQQFRWAKGAAECAKKNLPAVLKSEKITLLTKVHAWCHLSNVTVFPCIFISALLSFPMLIIKTHYPQFSAFYPYFCFSLVSLLLMAAYYWISATKTERISPLAFLSKFLAFLSFSMGFSLHNSIAVLDGYLGKKMPFVRTPKYNINSNKDSWKRKKYTMRGNSAVMFFEILLAIYFVIAAIFAVVSREYGILPFYILLSVGFGAVGWYTLWQTVTD